SPLDKNTFFVACNTITFIPFFISEGNYTTRDGGLTWYGSDTCGGTPIDYHGGDPGNAIDKAGNFILTRKGRTPFVGLYSHTSTDFGHTWSSQVAVSTDDLERASLTVDLFPSSPYYGRTYAAWVPFAQPFPLMLSHTDDGGQHWSAQKQINNPVNRSAGGDVAVGSDGKVYACWAGVTDFSPFKEVLVGFGSSSDGGATWSVNENLFPMSGISGLMTEKSNIRVNSKPAMAIDTTHGPYRGSIYIVTCQKGLAPAGTDPDIILYRSTDDGATWSSGIRVNQDPFNNGKIQYFPSIHVDQHGRINILFYDDRNTTSDSVGVVLARSFDGGNTWAEYEISDHHFKPAPIGGLGQGYQGDNIDINSNDTKLIPVWMDNSSGVYQIWTVPVDFADVNGVNDLRSESPSFILYQNTPNPVKNVTAIRWFQPQRSFISVSLLDQLGRQVKKLCQDQYSQGEHSIEINLDVLTPGIYFCQMRSNQQIITKKLVKE
ncbi:MAG: exo-alpha-sialidase, partial [Bacteroidota bacterium]